MSKYRPSPEGERAQADYERMVREQEKWTEVGRVAGEQQQEPIREIVDNPRRQPGGHDPKRC